MGVRITGGVQKRRVLQRQKQKEINTSEEEEKTRTHVKK
jgi:hypothetical protein